MNQPFSTARPAIRRGSMLVEVTVSAALLATLLAIIGQVMVQLHKQNRITDRYLHAQQTLENLMEDATRNDWTSLNSETISQLKLSETAEQKLPQAVLNGNVFEQTDPVLAKRVTLQLSWQNASGSTRPPLVLTTWVYKQPEDKP